MQFVPRISGYKTMVFQLEIDGPSIIILKIIILTRRYKDLYVLHYVKLKSHHQK